MVGVLTLGSGRMKEALRQEGYGHADEVVGDLFEVAGVKERSPRDKGCAPPKPPGAVSYAARSFIHGAMSVRTNYQQIMCASRMMHGPNFAPPPPGCQGPEMGY